VVGVVCTRCFTRHPFDDIVNPKVHVMP
jgi:hypothetical protein